MGLSASVRSYMKIGIGLIHGREGFNVLLYGLGSKKLLLDEFMKTHSSHFCIIVKGYFPALSLKNVSISSYSDS